MSSIWIYNFLDCGVRYWDIKVVQEMSTTTRVAQNVYRIDANSGDFINYLIRVKVSPTIDRRGTRKTFGRAIALRRKWLAERETLKRSKAVPIKDRVFRQWGYL